MNVREAGRVLEETRRLVAGSREAVAHCLLRWHAR
jgi:hypothetical protein